MLSNDGPMRSSLQVAPLAIQKGSEDLQYDAYTATGDAYSHSNMTPPATPSTAEEDGAAFDGHNAPPVFYNFLRAFYPFHPEYAITDSSVALPLNEGDVILVHSIHTNGWADGTLLVTGARGWLPTNYCECYEPEEMRNLLKALLNFWDLLRSTSVSDSEIFGNQEFMKGIIAGVRYLLVRGEQTRHLVGLTGGGMLTRTRSEQIASRERHPLFSGTKGSAVAESHCYLSYRRW